MLDPISDVSQRANLLRFNELSGPSPVRPQPINALASNGSTATQPVTARSPLATMQPCVPRPDVPELPGYRPSSVERGPNGFTLELTGPDPDLAVGGSHDEQEHQRDETVRLAGYAGASYESRYLPDSMRWPSDGQVSNILSDLKPNPPIGADGKEVTHGIYQSQIPDATPQQVYDHWIKNPNEVFNAGGMEIRPPVTEFHDGRYMLETGGTNAPPTWLPVEIKVDPAQHSINIKTLDGHVLRGEQTFTFKDNGCGGTTIVQDARFQASSKLVGDMQKFLPVSTGQHNAWQNAHRESYEQFNGDTGFKGIGIPLVDPKNQATALAGQAAWQALKDPGRAANASIDLLGDGGNLVYDTMGKGEQWLADQAGQAARSQLDALNLPGGRQVEQFAHGTGKVLGGIEDFKGDVVEKGADVVGDIAQAVVDPMSLFR